MPTYKFLYRCSYLEFSTTIEGLFTGSCYNQWPTTLHNGGQITEADC